MEVAFTLVREGARLPRRSHSFDVGLDVFTPTNGVLAPGMNKIPLGFTCDIPAGFGGSVYPRSGMASGEATKDMEIVSTGKLLVRDVVPNGIPVISHLPPIDPGYTGEVHLMVMNHSRYSIKYIEHTRFGQLVIYPIVYAVPVLHETTRTRGDKAFNSTGEVN